MLKARGLATKCPEKKSVMESYASQQTQIVVEKPMPKECWSLAQKLLLSEVTSGSLWLQLPKKQTKLLINQNCSIHLKHWDQNCWLKLKESRTNCPARTHAIMSLTFESWTEKEATEDRKAGGLEGGSSLQLCNGEQWLVWNSEARYLSLLLIFL